MGEVSRHLHLTAFGAVQMSDGGVSGILRLTKGN
jgi:hypothetical protein